MDLMEKMVMMVQMGLMERKELRALKERKDQRVLREKMD